MPDNETPKRTINFAANEEGNSETRSPARTRSSALPGERSSHKWNAEVPDLSSCDTQEASGSQAFSRNPLAPTNFPAGGILSELLDFRERDATVKKRPTPTGSAAMESVGWSTPAPKIRHLNPANYQSSVSARLGRLRQIVRDRESSSPALGRESHSPRAVDERSGGSESSQSRPHLARTRSSFGTREVSSSQVAEKHQRGIHDAWLRQYVAWLESSKSFHLIALLVSTLSLLFPSSILLTGVIAVELLHIIATGWKHCLPCLLIILELAGIPRFMWIRGIPIAKLSANFSRLRGLPSFLNQDEGNGFAENLSIQVETVIGNTVCLILCLAQPPDGLAQRLLGTLGLVLVPFFLTNYIGAIAIHPLEKTLSRCLTKMDPVPAEVAQVLKVGGYTVLGRIIERYAALSEASVEPLVQFAPGSSMAFIESMGTKLTSIRASLDSVLPPSTSGSRNLKPTQKWRRQVLLLRNAGLQISQVQTFDYTSLNQSGGVTIGVCKSMLEPNSGDCPRSVIENFIFRIRSLYHDNPYHNWEHGVDVMHSAVRFIDIWLHDQLFESHERFALYVASLAHDVGHPGLNNQFLILSNDQLALRYNDSSVLENFHCALLFKNLQSESENVLGHFSLEVYRECRRIIILTILATDLAKHFKQVKALRWLIEMNTVAFYVGQEEFRKSTVASYRIPDRVLDVLSENKDMCLETALHLADVGTILKPFDVCKKWANLILEEFFAQGDKEKELGLPVQMSFDRDHCNFCESQIGFAEVIVTPLLTLAAYAFPPTTTVLPRAETNICKWFDLWIGDGEKKPEEINVMRERIAAITDDFAEACQFKRDPNQESAVFPTECDFSPTSSAGGDTEWSSDTSPHGGLRSRVRKSRISSGRIPSDVSP